MSSVSFLKFLKVAFQENFKIILSLQEYKWSLIRAGAVDSFPHTEPQGAKRKLGVRVDSVPLKPGLAMCLIANALMDV